MSLEISVIVPTHGAAPYLSAALQSLVMQTRQADEIIVVDDGSNDAERRQKALLVDHYGCRFISNPARRGAAFARNAGATAANGEFLCFLDHDDVLLPASMEKKLRRLRAVPDAGLCYGGYVFVNESGQEIERPSIQYREGRAFCEALARFDIMLSPSCTVISRRCFQGVGGFNPDPALYHCEDYDLWLRIALGGWPVVAVPEPLSLWRRHACNWAHEFTAEKIDTATLILLLQAERRFPKWSQVLQNQRAQVLYRLGRYAAIRKEWVQAKQSLKGAIVAGPFFWKAHFRYLQALLASHSHKPR
jgi:glycosyltransferase involved in cell wall biosynthesis